MPVAAQNEQPAKNIPMINRGKLEGTKKKFQGSHQEPAEKVTNRLSLSMINDDTMTCLEKGKGAK